MKITVENIRTLAPSDVDGFISAKVSFSESSSGINCSALVEVLIRTRAGKSQEEVETLAVAEARRFLMRVVSSRD